MRIWIRNTAFFHANLRICDLRTGTLSKLADLRFADWHTSEICGFEICGLTKQFACPLPICVYNMYI